VDVPPSPKDQAQEFGELVEASRNWTVKGSYPDVTDVLKSAVGMTDTWLTVIKLLSEVVLLPARFVAVRVTVYEPGVV
jgi:hypothetical protein